MFGFEAALAVNRARSTAPAPPPQANRSLDRGQSRGRGIGGQQGDAWPLPSRALDHLALDTRAATVLYWTSVFLVAAGFFVTKLLPCVDYPQHLALSDIAHRLQDPSARENSEYQLNYFTYNGLFHIVVARLSGLLPVRACRSRASLVRVSLYSPRPERSWRFSACPASSAGAGSSLHCPSSSPFRWAGASSITSLANALRRLGASFRRAHHRCAAECRAHPRYSDAPDWHNAVALLVLAMAPFFVRAHRMPSAWR